MLYLPLIKRWWPSGACYYMSPSIWHRRVFNAAVKFAREAKGTDRYGYRTEFIQLVEASRNIKQHTLGITSN